MQSKNEQDYILNKISYETYNWGITEWRAFRNDFCIGYYEFKDDLSRRAEFNKWKLEQIIEFKVKCFDIRKEGTNG
jgi:hypothetical protein